MNNIIMYQVYAGWATLDYGISTFHDFCVWLMHKQNLKSKDIREDYNLIKQAFNNARNTRKEDCKSSIRFIAEYLDNACYSAIKHDLLTENEINDILKKYGLKYVRSVSFHSSS